MRWAALLAAALLLQPMDAAAQRADRIYVRRIELHGMHETADPVLRRELLQLEGTYLNTVALEQSRLRLERLPFVASASVALRPVPGKPDVVDVIIHVQEAPARRYGGGGAYSEALGASAHGYFVNENLFGTGRRLAVQLEASGHRSLAELSLADPYARPEGVRRTIAVAARDIDRLTEDTSRLEAELASLRVEYGYRSGATQSVAFGAELRRTELAAPGEASEQLREWIARNGDVVPGRSATELAEVDFLFRWQRDTRDRLIFPGRGVEQTLELRASLPGGDVEYYVAEHALTRYWTLGERWTVSVQSRLGFGAAYGGGTFSIPPYLRWFAGGPRTVRGFRESSLGPRDTLGNPYGGNALVATQLEALTPWPERWRERLRVGFFLDAGNVFATDDVRFEDAAGGRIDHGFDLGDLRYSAGLVAKVRIPLGTLQLSYGVPFDAEQRHFDPFRRDRVERLQISVGVEFR